jgi:hypothetical protein
MRVKGTESMAGRASLGAFSRNRRGVSPSDLEEGMGSMGARRLTLARRPKLDAVRKHIAAALCAVAGLALTATPALAAAPEAPVTLSPAQSVTATTATLEGTLNPGASAKAGWFFAYGTEIICLADGLRTAQEPEVVGEALSEKVKVSELQPDRTYTFCMYATNQAGEATPSANEGTFKTLAVPPEVVPSSESASVKASEATLSAQVNPDNQETTYAFEYSTKATGEKLEGTIETIKGKAALPKEEYGDVGVSVPTGAVLSPSTTYFYRVVAENEQSTKEGKPAVGPVQEFTTVPVPHTEAVELITAMTATFHGNLTPLDPTVPTEYFFYYGVGAEPSCTNEHATTPAGAGTGSGAKAVSTAVSELEPNQKYTVCLVSMNAFGSEEDPASPPVHFTTPPAPPTIEHESVALPVKATEAHLEGVVNPNNQVTECKFQYGTEPLLATGTTTALCEPGSLVGNFGGHGVGLNVAGLAAHTTYYYRVLATNPTGEETGATEHFDTALPPETPEKAKATAVTATTADLHGVLNPKAPGDPGSYEFLYNASATECQGGKASGGAATGATPEPVAIEVTGLLPGTQYTFCLRARNEAGEESVGPPETFTTLPMAPVISDESASGVSSDAATLDAEVDPGGVETTYRVEYGPGVSYGRSVEGVAGSGASELPVAVRVQGLAPGTTYHYRVLATNAVGSTKGPDQTFSTQGGGNEFALPDGRAWEMVSPPDKDGAGIVALNNASGGSGSLTQAAADGDGISYVAAAPFFTNAAGSRSPEPTEILSMRRAPGVWETQDLVTPHTEGAYGLRVGHNSEYYSFSSDLSLSILVPAGDTPLVPGSGPVNEALYLRTEDGEYKELPGKFEGATPDMSHIVLQTGPLDMWSGGNLEPVSILPNGELYTKGPFLGGSWSGGKNNSWHAISNNGSRIVFESDNQEIYLRDMTRKETIPVGNGIYQTANTEGSRVFVSEDVFELTSSPGEPLAGKVTHLAEGAGMEGLIGASEDGSYVYFVSNGVLGDAAERGALQGSCEGYASNESETCNLYMDRYDDAAKAWAPPTFIAALSGADFLSWGQQQNYVDREDMTSEVSPNGQYLAFMSEKSLTGYDNRDANSGVPDQEVFLYDASAGPDGRLVCASCDPTGARPVGKQMGYFAENEGLGEIWRGRWLAAGIPGWDVTGVGVSTYQPHYLSSSGRLFLDSFDSLVPADVNGKDDVYEYEPVGVGSCQPPSYGQSASVALGEGGGGCIGLVTAGTSPEESSFLDASESGGDVFFMTSSKLSPSDYDSSYDVYDAHECTAAAPCAPAPPLTRPPCTTGDACKASPTPQPTLYGSPSSETFSGAGNIVPSTPVATPKSVGQPRKLAKALRVCRRESKRRRVACESQARKRYGAKSSRAAGRSLAIAKSKDAGSKGAGR